MKLVLLYTLLLSLITFSLKAVTFNYWGLSGNNVKENLWIISNPSQPSQVHGQFSVTRKLIGSYPNGDPYFESINVVVNVCTYSSNPKIINFSKTITSADFEKNHATVIINVDFDIQPLSLQENDGPFHGVYYDASKIVVLDYSLDGGISFVTNDPKFYSPVTLNSYNASFPPPIPTIWLDHSTGTVNSENHVPQLCTRFGTSSSAILSSDSNNNMYSKNGKYELRMQGDGNLVLYNVQTNTALWASNTASTPFGKYQLHFQTDGNLVIYKVIGTTKTAIWDSGSFVPIITGNHSNARFGYFILQDDGNFVLYYPLNYQLAYIVGYSTGTQNGQISSFFGELN